MTHHAMRGLRAAAGALCALLTLNTATTLAAGKHAAPAASVGSEWASYNKTPDGQRYSPLRQINTSNAAELAEVCRIGIEDHG